MVGKKSAVVCLIVLAAFLLLPWTVLAQATINPTRALFEPSADHNATDATGAPIVQLYRLELFLVGATAPFQVVSLGKPNPDASGTITVDLTTIFMGWPVPGINYFADVAAVGPGGAAPSAPSNIFTFCTFTVSPTTQNVVAAGGPYTTAVTTTSGCTWNATSNANWITVTAGGTGTSSGTVAYTVAANPSTTPRTGTLTVAGRTVTITQQGTAACSFSVSPMTQSVVAGGAAHTTAVTTTSGCAWSATSNAGWITITAGSSGTSSGTVAYTVAAHTGTSSRTGTLTVAGQTVTVTQQGTACSFSVSPMTQSVVAGGAAHTTAVTTTSGCAWSATSNAGWITITAGSSGTSSGTVAYTVAAHTGTSSRTGTLTVAGQTVTVTQQGTACSFSVSPMTQSVVAGGAAHTTAVTTTSGCAWSATSNAGWLTITAGSSGTSSGTVAYTVAAHTGTSSRTGTLTVAGQTVTVTQQSSACNFSVSPMSQTLQALGGARTVTVTTASGCAWSATSNASWIAVTAGSSGTASGTVSFTVAANTSTSSRTGTLTVAGQTVSVTQNGACGFTIAPTSQNVPPIGGTRTTSVTTTSGCAWSTMSNVSWITVVAGSSGTSSGTATYIVAANTTTLPRTGTLTVAGQTVTVTEAASGKPMPPPNFRIVP